MSPNFPIVRYLLLLMNITASTAFGRDAAAPTPNHSECLVYFGTRSGGKSKGIYVSRLNTATGTLTSPDVAVETTDPAFLAIHPNHRFLYAVRESGGFEGTPNGAVSAFSIDSTTGKLTLLNQQNSSGQGPCHLAVDRSGQCVLVANYGSGSVAAFPVRADGSLGAVAALAPAPRFRHRSEKIKEGPHAHSVGFDLANRRAFCADLGLDKLFVYQLEPTKAALAPNDPPFAALKPGAGPAPFHLPLPMAATSTSLTN
jgi:6-phosphogluconolactonase